MGFFETFRVRHGMSLRGLFITGTWMSIIYTFADYFWSFQPPKPSPLAHQHLFPSTRRPPGPRTLRPARRFFRFYGLGLNAVSGALSLAIFNTSCFFVYIFSVLILGEKIRFTKVIALFSPPR